MTGRRWRLPPVVLGGVFLLLGLAGCAGHGGSFSQIEGDLVHHRPDLALRELDGRGGGGKSEALYRLDRGMILRMAGDFEESNLEFEAAKAEIESLSAVSVTENVTSLLINDRTRAFEGEPFEQVMIHVFEALNYLELSEPDEARVEALQIDVRLQALAEASSDELLATDPFGRYLTALIYEDLGEWSDALIAYRLALEAYRAHGRRYPIGVPSTLVDDLLRLTTREGLHEERERYEDEFGRAGSRQTELAEGEGELVFVLLDGLAPVKREEAVTLPLANGLLVRVAVPRYEVRRPEVAAARVRIAGREGRTERFENLNGLARYTLAARLPGITARAAARAAAKLMAARQAQKKNKLAGLLLNLAAVVAERADTRSWLTLPGEIQLVRVAVPPGAHRPSLELLGPTGGVIDRVELPEVEIRPGRKTFVTYHCLRP